MSHHDGPMHPESERYFRIAPSELRKRHINVILGLLFGVALCWLVFNAHSADSDKYNETLLYSVVVFVVLFCMVNLLGHIRYCLNSRKHHLEVGDDRITFVTGADRSVLLLSDVVLSERQSRLREGPSLMMQLENKRIVRLVGYKRQEDLLDLVSQRLASKSPESD